MKPQSIPLGENRTISIDSRSKLGGHIPVIVHAGEAYIFKVKRWQFWIDFFIPCSATGFNNILIKTSEIRMKGIKCFALCGSINDNTDAYFHIGKGTTHLINHSGFLQLWANDHPKHYWNNFSSIRVNIKRSN